MGLADKIADIIRPRPRGLFAGQHAPASVREALSPAMIADGATASAAREATQNFIRALSRDVAAGDGDAVPTIVEKLVAELKRITPRVQLPGKLQSVKISASITVDDPSSQVSQVPVASWDGVVLHGFDDDPYLSMDPAHDHEPTPVPTSVTCVIEGGDETARAYDQATTERIGTLAKEAGDAAGLRAAAAGASRQTALAKARDTEETARVQLQARVDAGEPLPIRRDLFERAGFDDVATRETPPPVLITCMPAVMSTTDRVGPDEMAMREMIRQVFAERLPEEVARGIRGATTQVVW